MTLRSVIESAGFGRIVLHLGGLGQLLLGTIYLFFNQQHAGTVEHLLLEVIVLIGFPLGILSFVHWFDDPSRPQTDYWRLASWWVLGTFGALLLTGLVLFDLYFAGLPMDSRLFSVLLAADTGALLGLLVGWEEVRVRTSVRRAERAEARAQISERHEERLRFLNRILRHHVLNGLNVILGATHLLRDTTTTHDDSRAHLDVIDERSHQMADYVEDIRTVIHTLADGEDPSEFDLASMLRQELESARHAFPNAEFEATIPDSAPVISSELAGVAFENLLENAIVHNDSSPPTVGLRVDDRSGVVRVSITDNGPGIPDGRKTAYFRRGEHGEGSLGEGLGLYLAETVITSTGGRIWIEDNPPRGTRVEVELEKAARRGPGLDQELESLLGEHSFEEASN